MLTHFSSSDDVPCDENGICMRCKKTPQPENVVACTTCTTPWHVTCLSCPPESMLRALLWHCPDCSMLSPSVTPVTPPSDLVAKIRAVELDETLSEEEKARKRQQLLSGPGVITKSSSSSYSHQNGGGSSEEETINGDDCNDIFDGKLNCSICMQLPHRPVKTPCGHPFCIECFKKWIGQGKRTCAYCRTRIPPDMASQPQISSALDIAISMAKILKSDSVRGSPKVYHSIQNQNRPDKAFMTERAKKAGKANACSGKIFVTVPPDYFGPILAENDPVRKQGILVGESWEDRLECRQWGVHRPHIAGIAGQSNYGVQSVALSRSNDDDKDQGHWFLYTVSGGRDFSGNKRISKTQVCDQKFENLNQALQISYRKGYPVRVVRSHKEKNFSYAPKRGVRYDGIYRIEKCWRKIEAQGYKVCRYLFVRCDNEPAPWTRDGHGDYPRPLPVIDELTNATDIMERKESPSWDYDVSWHYSIERSSEEKGCWMWKKPPPHSKIRLDGGNQEKKKRTKQVGRDKLLKEFSCQICQKLMMMKPVTTPCGHNFCKACLDKVFAGKSYIRESRRELRVQINVMKCPSCTEDIADFIQNPQVNKELMVVIESFHLRTKEMEHLKDSSEDSYASHDIVDKNFNSEICSIDDPSLESTKDKILKHHKESKPLITYKRKNRNGESGISNIVGRKGDKMPEQVNKVSGEKESGMDTSTVALRKEVLTDVRFKHTYQRKKFKHGGSMSWTESASP